MERSTDFHFGLIALSSFKESMGRLPRARNASDADKFVDICKNVSASYRNGQKEFDEKLLRQIAFQAGIHISPMTAFLGGIVAQEVLKSCSGKFHPIYQYFYFDSLESLPKKIDEFPEEEFQPVSNFI